LLYDSTGLFGFMSERNTAPGEQLPQHLVLRRGHHEKKAALLRRRIMVDRPGFGAMIISDCHLTTGDAAAAFKHQELFHGGVAMRGIAGARRKTEECGSPSGNRIEGEQLGRHPWSNSPPGSLRRFDERETLCRLLKCDLSFPIPDPFRGRRSNHQCPQEA
jgi:hypothetical protein